MTAKEIRALRKRWKLTPFQFAARVGVTEVTVRRWEAGTHYPSQLALKALKELKEA